MLFDGLWRPIIEFKDLAGVAELSTPEFLTGFLEKEIEVFVSARIVPKYQLSNLRPGCDQSRLACGRMTGSFGNFEVNAIDTVIVTDGGVEQEIAAEPDADWLTPVQREIDQLRQEEAQAMHRPEPATDPDAAYREACLAECENRHRSCREEIDPQTEENCLRNHEMTCEQRYESCMSDPSKLYMGEVSRESDCIGVHIECRKSIARDCATAAQNAERQCEAQMETCAQRCQNAE